MADSSDKLVVIQRKQHWYDVKVWRLYEWGLTISTMVLIFAVTSFLWADKTVFNTDNPIQFDKFGTFGDFVGGIVGTVFAFLNVHLLIKTIGLQNKANAQSGKSYSYVQRTENTRIMDTQINSLFTLYKDVVSSLQFHQKHGKDAIVDIAAEILGKSTNFFCSDGDDKKAMLAFEKQYAGQRDRLAVYFRVVYRMLCVLAQADISNSVRYNYAKMLRCQLTESELCLLRYNALTYNGKNMQDKILQFNILKHLPTSKLFELYPFFSHLDENFSNHLDVILFDLRKKLEETFVFGNHLDETVSFPTNIANFLLSYKVTPDRRCVYIIFQVNRKMRINSEIEMALVRFSDNEISMFFKAYLLELFSKSKFQVYTKVGELKFKRFRRDNAICLTMFLESQNQNRVLVLSRKQLDRPNFTIVPFFIGNRVVQI